MAVVPGIYTPGIFIIQASHPRPDRIDNIRAGLP